MTSARSRTQVGDFAKANSSVVLAYDGSAQSFFSGMAPPVMSTSVRGETTAGELARKFDQLSTARIAIVLEVANSLGFLNRWPEFKDQLSNCGAVVFKGGYFMVYRRSEPASQL